MALSLALLTGGRDHVLSQLAADKTWQRTRLKSAQGAASILVNITKRVCMEEAYALIMPEIHFWYVDYVKKNGPPPADRGSDWYEGHDDGLLELFEPFASVLSASWLGFATTDARMWQDDEDVRLANSFAAEIWKQLSWKRTDNQILAGVGIVASDLEVYGGQMATEETPEQQVEYTTMEVNAILNRIMLSFPDPKELADNLDLVSDNDDILAGGAAQRLGLLPEDVKVLQDIRAHSPKAVQAWETAILAGETLDPGRDYVDLDPHVENTLPTNGASDTFDAGPDLPLNLVRNALPPPPPPPPVGSLKDKLQASNLPPPPPPPLSPALTAPGSVGVGSDPGTNTGKPGRKKKVAEEPPVGAISIETLRSIKDHAGFKDETLAEMLGISRPTLANIMKGKTYCTPSADRRTALLNALLTHLTALTNAYKEISP
jgi:hypothetical protein